MSTSTPTFARTLARQIRPRRSPLHTRHFHCSRVLEAVKPFLLADIGEGITECQLIQWFVQPGARVQHFDKLCEVQSDKASVEITSPFDGVIKKLHYEPDDMAITGRPLVDIDIQGEISEEDEARLGGQAAEEGKGGQERVEETSRESEGDGKGGVVEDMSKRRQEESQQSSRRPGKGDFSTLATPAVRHLTKELDVQIAEVVGTGRDGRVLKEDVHRFVSQRTQQSSTGTSSAIHSSKEDRTLPLTPVQTQMFKLMTKALNIPHFLYSCSADLSAVTAMRKKLNASKSTHKLTHLPFIIKATSLALQQHPLLNSALDVSDPKKPSLTYRSAHNFGVAVDTPSGLLVPVIKNVQDLSIGEIASSLRDLSDKARNNKLSPNDFKDATFTVSNIGSVGGGVVAPIISEPQVAILGVGRSRIVPAFNEHDELVKREELVLSWSADHRVVDGAECARCAERVKILLEDPSAMLVEMR